MTTTGNTGKAVGRAKVPLPDPRIEAIAAVDGKLSVRTIAKVLNAFDRSDYREDARPVATATIIRFDEAVGPAVSWVQSHELSGLRYGYNGAGSLVELEVTDVTITEGLDS